MMDELVFDSYSPEDYRVVKKMILDFYEEDSEAFGESKMSEAKIKNTFERAISNPEHLKIEIFKKQDEIIGYAILCSFWSNEYGGLVLILDELYIIPTYRNKGISTYFIKKIMESKEYVQLNLEVLIGNDPAFSLYKRLGFEVIDRIFMKKNYDA